MKKPKNRTVERLRRKYLASHGDVCPYCGTDQIGSQEIDMEKNILTIRCSCSRCEREWHDVAKLVDVKLEPPKCDSCRGRNTAVLQCKCGQWLCQDCKETHQC